METTDSQNNFFKFYFSQKEKKQIWIFGFKMTTPQGSEYFETEPTVICKGQYPLRKVSTGTVRYGAFSFVLRKYFFT